ncbi:Bug family tripartite tricarboxylate transporter substrate binding protein [Muricoccus radiodurans]|uniref:Bug family tripartite tricarboxylate transporter substrate binding protein n=1 Tax=Muricoccus radiodurans TaxID=2231721 RepID=UPI003CF524EB
MSITRPTGRRALLVAAALIPVTARAQAPAGGAPRPRFQSLSVFVPANPGGGWDGLGRAVEQAARTAGLVGSFQFENVGGAGGTVGLPRFLNTRRGRSDALLVSGAAMVGATLTNRTPVSLNDCVPIARMTDESAVIVVPADSAFRTIGDLVAALRADARAVPVAGGGVGTTDHVAFALMLRALGKSVRDASFVAFPGGGPAQAAVIGGQVKAGIAGWSEFSEQARAGRVRLLATTGERRVDPAVPTLRESGLDVVSTNWRGLFGPPGLTPAARTALMEFATELHASAPWQAILAERGWDDSFLTGEAFEAFLARDRADTETVLKELGLA